MGYAEAILKSELGDWLVSHCRPFTRNRPVRWPIPFQVAVSLAALVHAENAFYLTQYDLDFRVRTASRARWRVFGRRIWSKVWKCETQCIC